MQGCELDPINNARFVRNLYELSNDTLHKYSVPVLWDKKTSAIVNNESLEIIRMFNSAFTEFVTGPYGHHDFYRSEMRSDIDELNNWIYPDINDGVYKCGFAKSQQAYNEAVDNLYHSLDRVDRILASSRYLLGNHLTEADIRYVLH